VTGTTFSTAAFWSYSLAAVGYLLLALRMALGWKGGPRGSVLLLAVLLTVVWATLAALFGRHGILALLLSSNAADTLRYAAWFAFVALLLAGGRRDGVKAVVPIGGVVVTVVLLVASVALAEGTGLGPILGVANQRAEFAARVGLAILGLVAMEQLYRRAHPQARWGLKPLVVGLAGLFGFDLYLYADGLLFGRLDGDIWVARGVASALVIPFIAISTVRNTGWTIEMHLSRGVVYQSTALLISGAFLLLVAGAGYLLRFVGGDWGRALQIELLFAAMVFGALALTSGRFRSRLKVFVSKHFFSYRYDYREEWLRFTRTLSAENAVLRPQERAIQAIADLVESTGGMLWLGGAQEGFRQTARLNMPPVDGELSGDASLARFLAASGWIVTVRDVARLPGGYAGLELPGWLPKIPGAWVIVPLDTGNHLVGFVVLADPRAPVDVDWEVRDLLKAAGRAAAAYLAQMQATEALLEARKFDAFNRMSAFVVHDLKNLVAQLSLMLRNAERHRDNPEFQRDMLDTVQNVVTRMNGLMLQLRTGTKPVENARPVDLEPVVRRVCASKAQRPGAIDIELVSGITALGHEDRLEHVIGHLVQNALDATAGGGGVRVATRCEDGFASIEVADTGTGMSPDFVRERLFKPFETTKAAGMGIGVYESQQYITGLGGRIDFDTREGAGTRVRVLLPQGDGTPTNARSIKEAA
jgi:putative PEP-CTERM system histidine kinase